MAKCLYFDRVVRLELLINSIEPLFLVSGASRFSFSGVHKDQGKDEGWGRDPTPKAIEGEARGLLAKELARIRSYEIILASSLASSEVETPTHVPDN